MQIAELYKVSFFPMAAAIVALWIPTTAFAQGGIPGFPASIYSFDSREVAMLPRYCIYTQHYREMVPGGNDTSEIQRWSSAMGEAFIHLHHYCYGLMFLNRATVLARDARPRRFYLQNAMNEFDYVLQRAPQSFVLLPEILTKKGDVLVRQGRAALAIEEFERAIELKPDYWPPYAHLSDHYRGAGDPARARQWLEKGLSLSPDAKGLQRRLAELDADTSPRKAGAQGASRKQEAGSPR